MTKRFTFLIFTILFCCVLGVAQEATAPTNNETTKTEIDETKILLNTPSTESTKAKQPEFSFFGSLWKFIIMLVIVCGLAYFVLHMLKRANAIPFNDDPYLKVASSLKLAPNKILYIITLKREAFLISVTEKAVSLIAKIEDTELIDALNLNAENFSVEQKPFAEMLSALFTKGGKNSKPTSNAANNTNANRQTSDIQTSEMPGDFLSEMRERLNNTGANGASSTSKAQNIESKSQNTNKGDA